MHNRIKQLLALLICGAALAATIGLRYDYPDDEFPHIKEFRLYGNGDTLLGTSTNLTIRADFAAGEHSVYVTAVSHDGVESDKSNTVTFWVPMAVTNIAVIITQ